MLTRKLILIITLAGLSWLQAAHSDTNVIRTVETSSYHDVLKLFNEIGYTADAWHAGIRVVPRIELTHIPLRWQEETRTLPVEEKKNIFFRLAGSGILQANEKIIAERKRLLQAIDSNQTSANDWLAQLAVKYKVATKNPDQLDSNALNRLVERVDIIPPSLALAQAAEESGWGTSRFAIKGNSLFGQWDFSGKGIKPEEQRAHLGNYGIAAFDTPQDSIDAYMLNLNTHRAYKRLREQRALARQKQQKPAGWPLAKTLDKYSERGIEYVKSLHAIMKFNRLNDADQAYLWNKGRIIVSPAP